MIYDGNLIIRVPLSPATEILMTPEIVMLSSVFVNQGVTKIRLAGAYNQA